jgi:hypothetical protein
MDAINISCLESHRQIISTSGENKIVLVCHKNREKIENSFSYDSNYNVQIYVNFCKLKVIVIKQFWTQICSFIEFANFDGLGAEGKLSDMRDDCRLFFDHVFGTILDEVLSTSQINTSVSFDIIEIWVPPRLDSEKDMFQIQFRGLTLTKIDFDMNFATLDAKFNFIPHKECYHPQSNKTGRTSREKTEGAHRRIQDLRCLLSPNQLQNKPIFLTISGTKAVFCNSYKYKYYSNDEESAGEPIMDAPKIDLKLLTTQGERTIQTSALGTRASENRNKTFYPFSYELSGQFPFFNFYLSAKNLSQLISQLTVWGTEEKSLLSMTMSSIGNLSPADRTKIEDYFQTYDMWRYLKTIQFTDSVIDIIVSHIPWKFDLTFKGFEIRLTLDDHFKYIVIGDRETYHCGKSSKKTAYTGHNNDILTFYSGEINLMGEMRYLLRHLDIKFHK